MLSIRQQDDRLLTLGLPCAHAHVIDSANDEVNILALAHNESDDLSFLLILELVRGLLLLRWLDDRGGTTSLYFLHFS